MEEPAATPIGWRYRQSEVDGGGTWKIVYAMYGGNANLLLGQAT